MRRILSLTCRATSGGVATLFGALALQGATASADQVQRNQAPAPVTALGHPIVQPERDAPMGDYSRVPRWRSSRANLRASTLTLAVLSARRRAQPRAAWSRATRLA